MRRMLRFSPILVLVLSLALMGQACGTFGQTLLVTGESLKAVGTEFVQVSAVYTQGCTDKTIPVAQCDKYRAFGTRFKQTYPLAVNLWESARTANDAAAEKMARDVILQLASELSALAVQGLSTFGGTK